MKKSHKIQLKEYTDVLLKSEIRYDELKEAVDASYDLYRSVSGLREDAPASREAVFLPTGKAIDSFEAGMCVKEFMRTKKFVAGLYEAILEAQNRFPNRKIHILYAGTGPFATLMLPMTSIFSPDQIKFTLLEINKHSINCLKKLITEFDVWDYVQDIVETDASMYSPDKSESIHIFLTETMQRALNKEPQVSITLNLIDQIEENAIMIPQNIRIDAVLFDHKRNKQRMFGVEGAKDDYYEVLGRVIDFDRGMAKMHGASYRENRRNYTLPIVTIEFPEKIDQRFSSIKLMTQIHVYNEHVLSYYESSLNLPEKLLVIEDIENLPKHLELQYVISDIPKFKIVNRS
ncbi:phytanoyl-CoA dioxygenase [Fusibacter sp. JL216-2]|uniref:phytanoyl-CoA dioxygenase n=1 Tax=Fusibacter sp. JL216-2 TaxID=3071453 RepID=UPI003D32935A